MIHELSISISEIVSECIAQTALDFRALRLNNREIADALYDDFTMSIDDKSDIVVCVKSSVATLNALIRISVKGYYMDENVISYTIEVRDAVRCDSVQNILKDYFKHSVLSWWYSMRNAELSQQHALMAVSCADELLSIVTPKFSCRKVRFF